MYHTSGRWWRWKFRNVLSVILLLLCIQKSAVLSCQVDCNQVLTSAMGSFSSPCYPDEYPPSQACKWTIQAPVGFIVQITFLEFELEEVLGCIYDRVIVSTGSNDVKFCGITANGLTLNSTGNVMEVAFNSDFSVQKRGFNISYRQVAVALRNQKVILLSTGGKTYKVLPQIVMPTLQQFTVCFEIARISSNDDEKIFSYSDSSGDILVFGLTSTEMTLEMADVVCGLGAILSRDNFTSTMMPFCFTWSSATGRVSLYFNNSYRMTSCTSSKGKNLRGGGTLQLGSKKSSFEAEIYNFRMWNYTMTMTELSSLTCDSVGNVIDWENGFWDIPSSHSQTDSTLSCICYPNCIHLTTTPPSSGTFIPTFAPQSTSCGSPGLGCPATLTPTTTSIVTTNLNDTNPSTHVQSTSTPPSTTPSMPLTSYTTTVYKTTSSPSATNNTSAANSMSPVSEPTTVSPSASTNTPAINNLQEEGLFYKVSVVVNGSQEEEVKSNVMHWLIRRLENWTYPVFVSNVSVQCPPSLGNPPIPGATTTYACQALLISKQTINATLLEKEIISWLMMDQALDSGLVWERLRVEPVECKEDKNPSYYTWPQSRPTITEFLPCLFNKTANASRTCKLNWQNYTAFWDRPDLSYCTAVEEIVVSAENAAEVATTLIDMTSNEPSTEEVLQVVNKLREIITVARFNASLASTVVEVFSNVMTGSDTALANSSEVALKMMDEMILKIEFDGPSLSIVSKNLALGISSFNSTQFNGSSFSAYIENSTDLKIDFEATQQNPLAAITLPATLLSNLTDEQANSVSRINFLFFSKTGFFPDLMSNGPSLNSYVVASSVANQSISNLEDPVQIEIVHLEYKPLLKPVCVFWDFNLKNGKGGWNSTGCRVGPNSNGNKTVCLCNHLTHFGILMDISGAAALIDEQNNKILTFITYIGCGISAIFSAATLLTYIAFEKLRRDYPSKILMNLSTSLLFLNMVFLLDGWLASFDKEGLCISVAIFLHFFLLTSFTWMGLESIHMYIALVKVFNTYIRRYILKFCIVGWGVPAAIVAIVVAIDRNSYGKKYYGKGVTGQGSSEFCWVTSQVVFYVTCVGYFSVLFLMNVAMFIVVMIQICGRNGKRSNRTLREEVLRNLRSVVSLTFLLGMTWGFAFFAWGPVNLAFMYLFSIFNSLQGLFIFIFHCALKENVQKQWRRYLCCGRFRLADNSDWSKTATNNTKKVSSDNLAKSLSSCSFGSSTANWTSKAKATLNPFAKRSSHPGKGYSTQSNPKFSPSDADASPIIPVHQVIDKVKGYCSAHSDNFYKNIIMSDSFSNSTKF